jgi:hypothetical protein
MIVALLLVIAVEVAQASSFGVMLSRFHWMAALQTLTFDYMATVLLIVAIGLVFYFIPNAKTRFRDVWVGAGADRHALAPRLQCLCVVHRPQQEHDDDSRIDCRGGRLSPVGVRLLNHPHVWRRVHRRLRAAAPSSSGRHACSADAASVTRIHRTILLLVFTATPAVAITLMSVQDEIAIGVRPTRPHENSWPSSATRRFAHNVRSIGSRLVK